MANKTTTPDSQPPAAIPPPDLALKIRALPDAQHLHGVAGLSDELRPLRNAGVMPATELHENGDGV